MTIRKLWQWKIFKQVSILQDPWINEIENIKNKYQIDTIMDV